MHEVARILNRSDVRTRFYDPGIEPVGDTSEQFAQYIKSELVKYADVVKQSNMRVE